jgi:mRNA-degrading endonuclease YafQ of YafQ-DinJ toxin-antitoxin module
MENLTFNYLIYLSYKLKFTWNSHKNCALQSDYNFIYTLDTNLRFYVIRFRGEVTFELDLHLVVSFHFVYFS